jgi:GTP-binding protein HflX
MSQEMHETGRTVVRERALLVGVILPGDPPTYEPPLTELRRLAETAGADVVDLVMQRRGHISPASYVGHGKAAEIAETVAALGIDVVITNHDLSPAQIRNLEKVVGCKVLDRSELILDIFATHARTRQARVQVEVAQLEYTRPRLRRMWTHLSRIEGGIGLRGPGETQIELDKRLVARRLRDLRRELALIERRRHQQASSRREYFSVSLVGYTNAGKSSLLRALTGARVRVEDQLFSTLDTRTREWVLPGNKRVFLSDTVGFIRDLPHHLVASFHATLEEARHADLLLHVIDAANPDLELHIEAVGRTLDDVGASWTPRILVFNKADRLEDRIGVRHAAGDASEWVVVSAHTGEGLEDLQRLVAERIERRMVDVVVEADAGDGKLLARLAETGTVRSRTYEDGRVRLEVRLPRREALRLARDAAERPGLHVAWEGAEEPPRPVRG